MPIYQIDGMTPVVPDESYVHPTAVLIGDVILGKGVYVGPNASLRGDFGRIVVKDGANIQDNCVMHGFPGQDTVVEEDGHIGHGACQSSDCRQSGESDPHLKRAGNNLEEAGDAGVSGAGRTLPADSASGGAVERSGTRQKTAGV